MYKLRLGLATLCSAAPQARVATHSAPNVSHVKEVVRTPGVSMIRDLLNRWPAYRQLESGSWRGTGEEAMSEKTKNLQTKHHGAEVAKSICPYCGVGCTLTVHVQDDAIVKVTSPQEQEVTHGHLCIKGRFGWQWVNQREKPNPSEGPSSPPDVEPEP